MTYTGDVTPGGPPAVRELTDLTITKVSVGPMDNNAYLLRCRATGEQVLIDAANERGHAARLIGDAGLAAVVTTHRHGDHWQALAEVVDATGARTVAGRGRRRGHPGRRPTSPSTTATRSRVGRRRAGGRSTSSATRPARSRCSTATRHGHPHLFTGDCLFPGGVGNTHGDPERLRVAASTTWRPSSSTGCRTRPGSTRATARTRTLGAERPHLAEWRARGW